MSIEETSLGRYNSAFWTDLVKRTPTFRIAELGKMTQFYMTVQMYIQSVAQIQH